LTDVATTVTDTNTVGIGAITVSMNAAGAYTLTGAGIEKLGAGERATVTFDVQVIDDSADGATDTSVAQTITLTLDGSNDTPTITESEAIASLVEAGGVANVTAGTATSSITMTIADIDAADTATFDVGSMETAGWVDNGATYTKAGIYGNAVFTVSTGVVDYTLENDNAATQGLNAGQPVTDTFAVITTDGVATATANAVFNITGTNDAAVITVSVSEDTDVVEKGDDLITDNSANGILAISDTDDNQGNFVSTLASLGSPLDGTYGTFGFNLVNGEWTYTLNEGLADELADGEPAEDTLTVTSDDLTEHVITVNIMGTNDGPLAVADTGVSTDENVVIDINVLANDTDVDDNDTHTVDSVSITSGPDNGTVAIVDNKVQWNPGGDFNYLAVGQSATVGLAYDMSDNNGGISSSTVTITVNGTNDAVSIFGQDSGSVTEVVDNAANENSTIHTAGGLPGGLLLFSDVDLTDAHTVSVAQAIPADTGYLGALTATVLPGFAGSGSGLVSWGFSVEDSVIDHVNAGEVLTQNYIVTVSDGEGSFVDQSVEIKINGAADPDLDIVVFDLVQGVSSEHSGREFDAGRDYKIYIKVNSSLDELITTPIGTLTNDLATWGNWTGAEQLTSDDQIIFIGTGAALEGAISVANTAIVSGTIQGLKSTHESWAVRVNDSGNLIRNTSATGPSVNAQLWTGIGTPALDTVFASAYEISMPALILTSQGLV
jgi:VCBS repeat-containing protein